MTFSLRGSNSANFVSTGSAAGAISGLASGDFIFARGSSISGAFTAKSGWTTISLQFDGNTGTHEYIAYRIADGTGTDSFNPSFAGGGSANLANIAWSNNLTMTFDASNHTDISNSTSFAAGNVTPTANNDLYILYAGDTSGSGATITLPGGFTNSGISFENSSWIICYKVLSGQSGVAQNQVLTFSTASYGPCAGLAVKESGGGGGSSDAMILMLL